MIHVQRDRLDSRGDLIGPEDSWAEHARQAQVVANREAGTHKAHRDVYCDDRVRAALEALFHDKCAYCESTITAGFDWEVEHFRPKASVAERPDHPGYYWLAYKWSNLYPSCTLCNQRRRDRPRWGDCSRAVMGGKGDQFPLVVEGDRAMSEDDDLALEQPLLLDPCLDRPDQFLSYDSRGDVVALADRGTATIAVFHLDRRRLRDRRRKVVEEVVQFLTFLHAEGLSDEVRKDFLDCLRRFRLEDSCEYAAAARAVLRDPAAFGLPTESVLV